MVYGPNVMRGYHQRERTTGRCSHRRSAACAPAISGRLDGDGYLHITGRIKEQYKLSNGKYVAPAPLEERLKLSPLIANVVIHGDNRPFNVALVVPQLDDLRALRPARADPGRLPIRRCATSPAIRAAVRAEIDRLSAEWRGYERVRDFVLLPEDFTQQNDMLTPSLKIKRRNVMARWRRRDRGAVPGSGAPRIRMGTTQHDAAV